MGGLSFFLGGKMGKPKLQLTGQDGNAFNILGLATKAARTAGWPKEKIDKFTAKAMAGNYDELLQTCMKFFDVQ